MQRLNLLLSDRPRSAALIWRGLGLTLLLLLVSFGWHAATAQANCRPAGELFGDPLAANADCPTLAAPNAPSDEALPPNFQDTPVFSGLLRPTAVQFAADGRVFVAQRNGVIKVFANFSATTPITVANLSLEVDSSGDRGLLGLALDPNFPAQPDLYALYTFDAPIGGSAPTWNDHCPTPPGPSVDGCVVSGRLTRLTLDPTGTSALTETVLLNAWCQQFPSHSIGTVRFGPDGALYAGAGEGANYYAIDYGQNGGSYTQTAGLPLPDVVNPCGDPPTAAGTPPPTDGTATGGSLRAQSLNRPAGDPVVLNGTIIRVDPQTGEALPTNPLYGASDTNARRIIGYGFRNPFRFTIRPGTNELWVGDVGETAWEEIDRIITPTAAPVNNFGWPCYEGDNSGNAIHLNFQAAHLNLCEALYAHPISVTAPYFAYAHTVDLVPAENCPYYPSSAITGLAFYTGFAYPASYAGTLFFADHSRNCIWAMLPGAGGLPDKGHIVDFVTGAAHPVDLEIGPGGDLFYVDLDGGTIRRIQYLDSGHPLLYRAYLPLLVQDGAPQQ